MSRRWYKPGDYISFCRICGNKAFASQLRPDWQRFMVCRRCFHPLPTPFIPTPTVPEEPPVPFIYTGNENQFDNTSERGHNPLTDNWYGYDLETGILIVDND